MMNTLLFFCAGIAFRMNTMPISCVGMAVRMNTMLICCVGMALGWNTMAISSADMVFRMNTMPKLAISDRFYVCFCPQTGTYTWESTMPALLPACSIMNFLWRQCTYNFKIGGYCVSAWWKYEYHADLVPVVMVFILLSCRHWVFQADTMGKKIKFQYINTYIWLIGALVYSTCLLFWVDYSPKPSWS